MAVILAAEIRAASHPITPIVKTVCYTRREITTLTQMVVPLVMVQLYKAELGLPASPAIVSSGMKANRVEAIAAVLAVEERLLTVKHYMQPTVEHATAHQAQT